MPGLFLVSGVFDTLCTQHLVYLGASSMQYTLQNIIPRYEIDV